MRRGLVLVMKEWRGGNGLRVDGADHAGLAVLALRAVEPDGLGVGDLDRVGQLAAIAGDGGGGHEARVEAGARGVGHGDGHGHAGGVEGGLDDGVVLSMC